ncbi:MAG: hypothetical protein IJ228_01105 [Succinivibrio sp.]|nr:hypothetical protein [Succinivibrio sp.]
MTQEPNSEQPAAAAAPAAPHGGTAIENNEAHATAAAAAVPAEAGEEKSAEQKLQFAPLAQAALEKSAAIRGERYVPLRDKLPEAVREHLKQNEAESARDLESGSELGQGGPSLYGKAQRYIKRRESGAKKGKLAFNARIIAVCALMFAAYYAYRTEVTLPRDELSLEDLKSRVPVRLDEGTSLTEVSEGEGYVGLTILKDASALRDLDEEQRRSLLDDLELKARGLCDNHAFKRLIQNGRALNITLDATDGSFHRVVILDSCPTASD